MTGKHLWSYRYNQTPMHNYVHCEGDGATFLMMVSVFPALTRKAIGNDEPSTAGNRFKTRHLKSALFSDGRLDNTAV